MENTRECMACGQGSLVRKCVCGDVVLCSKCAEGHLSTPGEHKFQPARPLHSQSLPVFQSNLQCSHCQTKEAVHVCTCEFPTIPLCLECTDKHELTQPWKNTHHARMNVKVYPFARTSDYLTSLESRRAAIGDAEKRFSAFVHELDEGEAALEAYFATLIASITAIQREVVDSLRRRKADFHSQLEEAMSELAEHIYEDMYVSTCPLTNAILKNERPALTVITDPYEVLCAVRRSVFTDIDLTGKTPGNCVVPLLTANSLLRWDSRLKAWRAPIALKSRILIGPESVWTWLESGQLVACYCKKPYIPSPYLIDPQTGGVTTLPAMNVLREDFAMIGVKNTVLVLGGRVRERLRTSELFAIVPNSWVPLSDMHDPRSSFTPCLYRETVYIAGGYGSDRVEMFHWPSMKFSLLPLKVNQSQPSLVYMVQDTMVILQSNHYYQWRIGSKEVRKVAIGDRRESWANCPALVLGSTIYFVSAWARTLVVMGGADAYSEVALTSEYQTE